MVKDGDVDSSEWSPWPWREKRRFWVSGGSVPSLIIISIVVLLAIIIMARRGDEFWVNDGSVLVWWEPMGDPWWETLPPSAAATRVFNRDLGVSHTDMHSIYTTGKNKTTGTSHFSFWVGLVPYLELLGGSCLKKHSVNILSPFLRNLSAVIFMDSPQRGNGGTQIAGKFLRDVFGSFRKARQKIHSLCWKTLYLSFLRIFIQYLQKLSCLLMHEYNSCMVEPRW